MFVVYCFCVIPIFFIVNNLLALNIPRLISDFGLVAFVLIKILIIFCGNKLKLKVSPILFLLIFISFSLGILRFIFPLIDAEPDWVMGGMEFKPLVYIAISILMMVNVKGGINKTVVRSASVLAVIVTFDCIIRTLQSGTMQRAISTGEINYEALLLVIALCLLMSETRINKKYFIVIFTGLLATMSRTGLITIIIVSFMSNKVPFRFKVFLAILAVIFIALSVSVRGLGDAGLDGIDRYWMWVVAINLFESDPLSLLTAFNPYLPLPVSGIPNQLQWLFNYQMENKAMTGFYPFTFHSMWLRLFVTWGWAGFLSFFILIFILVNKKTKPLNKSLAIVVLLQGMTMGVIYIGYVCVMLVTVFLSNNYLYRKVE